uniref:UDP-glucuronosyltransferase n=1 Tax=Steinernema glaseri TaxID=37863 RepID=A0A1I7Y3K0_9BILA
MRLLCFLVLLLPLCSGYKVLVYAPRLGHSHVSFLGTLADVLVESGLDVTVLLADLHPSVTTNGTKLARTLFVKAPPNISAYLGAGGDISEYIWKAETRNPLDQIELYKTTRWIFSTYCKNLYEQTDLIEQLKAEQFDVVISEAFDVCIFGAIKRLQIKTSIIVSSTVLLENTYLDVGVPLFPSFVPGLFASSTDRMSIVEKVKNAVGMGIVTYYGADVLEGIQVLSSEKFGNDATDVKKELSECAFVFVNTDPFLDFARPTLEKVVNIGGIAVRKAQPLNEVWSEILTRRTKNVLISFGSVAPSRAMPPDVKAEFINMMKAFPEVTFIWKYEKPEDKISFDIPNLVETEWMPQTDLLNDPRMTLFITHGGMASVLESANGGVPMLVIPIFADQMRNSKMVTRAGIGLDLSKHDIAGSDLLATSVRRLLQDKEFKMNVERLARMMQSRPTPVRDLLVSHVKFAAEFGKLPNLRPVSVDMSMYQYLFLDVIALVLSVIFVTVAFLVLIVYLFFKVACSKLKKMKSE